MSDAATPEFFAAHDDRYTPLVAPGVYRDGSHTTILVSVDEDARLVEHVPVNEEGLRLERTSYNQFRAAYVSTPYPVRTAAAKYLSMQHLACDDAARHALSSIVKCKEDTVNETAAKSTDEGQTGETTMSEVNKASKSAKATKAAKPKGKSRADKAREIADDAARINAELKAKRAAKKDDKAKVAAAKKTAKAAGKKVAAKKSNGAGTRGLGIGVFCKDQILAGLETEKIVERAQAKFPGCKVNAAHISWYRGKLREEGRLKD